MSQTFVNLILIPSLPSGPLTYNTIRIPSAFKFAGRTSKTPS
jgi:hypothetical protein